MRAYIPVDSGRARSLLSAGFLAGPHPAWVVDPQWRAGAPDVDEEEWEYEAAELAAASLASRPGILLAAEVAAVGPVSDGATEIPGTLPKRDIVAILTADLAWYAVQELPELLQSLTE